MAVEHDGESILSEPEDPASWLPEPSDFLDIEAFVAEYAPHAPDVTEDDAYEEQKVAEVLAVTWKEKRLEISKLQKARKFEQADKLKKTFRVEVEELKRRTKCFKCKKVGHWSRDCRSKGKGFSKGSGKQPDSGAAYVEYCVFCVDIAPTFEVLQVSNVMLERLRARRQARQEIETAEHGLDEAASEDEGPPDLADSSSSEEGLAPLTTESDSSESDEEAYPPPVNEQPWQEEEFEDTGASASTDTLEDRMRLMRLQTGSKFARRTAIPGSHQDTHEVCLVSSPGFGVIDSGCGKTIIGRETLEDFSLLWAKQGLPPAKIHQETNHFKFGNGQRETSDEVATMPVGIYGQAGSIQAAIVAGSAPLLISRPALKILKAKLDFVDDTILIFGSEEPQPLIVNAAGQYTINVLDFQQLCQREHLSPSIKGNVFAM